MAKFTTSNTDYLKLKKDNKDVVLIKKDKFDSFNEDILGLGTLNAKSKQINALSVIFDLEGFTNFCKQIDPQLAVPEYLHDFLKWLFDQIKKEVINSSFPEGYKIFCPLPFLSKYMGDGVLFLWDTEKMSETDILNAIVSMKEICLHYETEFYKTITKKIVSPPKKLRCGIARGAIYSVGDGNDFVGPCINMSARLQKLNSLSFCFSRRGLDPEKQPHLHKLITTKKTDIRGIGETELVCVLKKEYDNLPENEKEKFHDI